MKIKYVIPTVGDGGNESTSSLLIRIDNENKKIFRNLFRSKFVGDKDRNEYQFLAKNLNQRGERVVTCRRVTMNVNTVGNDPVLDSLSAKVGDVLFPTKNYDDKSNFMNTISFKYYNGLSQIFYGRTNNRYYINGLPRNKNDIIKAISKIILRASLTRCAVQLNTYVVKVTTFPHNVLYALENRTPYHFNHQFTQTEVVINTKLISDNECVLEISDSVWELCQLRN